VTVATNSKTGKKPGKLKPHVVKLEAPPPKPTEPDLPLVRQGDFEPFSECDEPLTDAQIKAIRNMTYFRAMEMERQGKWSPEEEAAFMSGAMCVFFALKSQMKLPASWLMSTSRIIPLLRHWKAEGKLRDGA
jgi:hypothetical protein